MKNYNQILSENIDWVKDTFKKIDTKLQKVAVRSRNKVVDGVDENGVHKELKRASTWTSGFFGGLNYLMYDYTKNEEYLKTAKRQEELLDAAFDPYEVLHHDVGFIWHQTSAIGYELTGDENSKRRALFAASTLFSRFIPSGGFIRAWNRENTDNWTIIDSLMNLPLLYWASEKIGDDRFKQIAIAQADTAILDHLRDDGSVVHIVEHNRETGECEKTYGGQGYCEGSSWSRGQSWALYGFIISYIHTGEERYLNAAKKVAHYFIANCCDDWLPRVDFRAPAEPVYYDSTAGACAACGLIEIAKHVGEHEQGMYLNAAINLLRAMDKKFMNYDPNTDDMLDYGSVRYPSEGRTPEEANVHISIIYGDYFYTEAILKLLGADLFPW